MHRLLAAAVLVSSYVLSPSAHALSCSSRLIEVGDSTVRVRGLCGEPAEIRSVVEHRSRQVLQRVINGVVVSDVQTVEVVIERWTYDFGPQRFMQELTF